MDRPKIINRMMDAFRRLPGVGPKMAERLSYYILKSPASEVNDLVESISEAKRLIKVCRVCFNLTENDPCGICEDLARDTSVICVVENSQDLIALNQVKNYPGMYFVLGGALSPLDAVGPKDLHVRELINRLKNGKIKEVILATDTDSKGETTALYLAEQIKPLGIKVTRLGYGLPVGGDLEYADEMTLTRAIEGRREM